MNNLVIVSVSKFQGENAQADKNGLDSVYLTPIAGKAPNRNVLAGTVAMNTGLEVGKSYLTKYTRIDDDPEYGPQYSWTKVSEVSDPLQIIQAEATLGAGMLFDVERAGSQTPAQRATADEVQEG